MKDGTLAVERKVDRRDHLDIKASRWPSLNQMGSLKKAGQGVLSQGFTLLQFILSFNSGICQNADLIGLGRVLKSAAARQEGDLHSRVMLPQGSGFRL